MSTMDTHIIQLHIVLEEIRPVIWRRFLVGNMIPFERLHTAIQTIMGWENAHLFRFQVDDLAIQPAVLDSAPPDSLIRSPKNLWLNEVLNQEGQTFQYIYDFGDYCCHQLKLEVIHPLSSGRIPPVCLEGARACPPEDCGGPWRYMELVDALRDPKSVEPEAFDEEELNYWREQGIDPEAFDLDAINKKLVRMRSR
jgi:hypothetical protein